MSCFLSIITATFNRATYLPDLFASLCQQTYKNFEWIVCDDGSQDNTWSFLQEMSRKADFKMRILRQENRGKHIALNNCVNVAEGLLVFFLDSDDLLTSDAVEWTYQTWSALTPEDQTRLCGIVAQKSNLRTRERLARLLAYDGVEMTFLDAFFKFDRREENHKIIRTDVYRKFLSPEVHDGSYFPENIGNWFPMARKYSARFYNRVIYQHNFDSESIQRKHRPGAPCKQWGNMVLAAKLFMENYADYFFYDPKLFYISAAQYSLYSLKKGDRFTCQFRKLKGLFPKLLFFAALPVGLSIYYIREFKFGVGTGSE
jgi:glycosyltransferase involved in cell wall biosynthesis